MYVASLSRTPGGKGTWVKTSNINRISFCAEKYESPAIVLPMLVQLKVGTPVPKWLRQLYNFWKWSCTTLSLLSCSYEMQYLSGDSMIKFSSFLDALIVFINCCSARSSRSLSWAGQLRDTSRHKELNISFGCSIKKTCRVFDLTHVLSMHALYTYTRLDTWQCQFKKKIV